MAKIYNGVDGKAHAFEYLQSLGAIDETMDLLTEERLEPKDRQVLEETVKFLGAHIEMQSKLSLGELKIS